MRPPNSSVRLAIHSLLFSFSCVSLSHSLFLSLSLFPFFVPLSLSFSHTNILHQPTSLIRISPHSHSYYLPFTYSPSLFLIQISNRSFSNFFSLSVISHAHTNRTHLQQQTFNFTFSLTPSKSFRHHLTLSIYPQQTNDNEERSPPSPLSTYFFFPFWNFPSQPVFLNALIQKGKIFFYLPSSPNLPSVLSSLCFILSSREGRLLLTSSTPPTEHTPPNRQ